jgi:hypothetical protein
MIDSDRRPATGDRRPAHRLIAVAGRTSQALARLRYDVEPLFSGDDRLRLAYTLIPGSRFASGAPEFAARNAIALLPWAAVPAMRPDLVVTSSPDPCLYEAGAPVISLPHGAGHNRLRPELSGVSGLSPEQIRGPQGQTPDLLALPGPAALRRLAVDCPEAVPHAEVCGDVCFERLRAGTALRDRYRDALGIAPGRRLVVLSSSWDLTALARRDQTLPERLFAELPMDEFAVAYIPHPNESLGGGPSPTGLLRPYLANGLIMIPPDEGWRAVLAAADCLIGDHGSVTFYGAALGIPTLLAAFGFANMPPELPLARFGRAAPHFDRTAPAAPQIRRAIEQGPLEFGFADALAEPDPGPAARIHAAAYRFLGLAAPSMPAPQPVPVPAVVPEHAPTTSWRCTDRTRFPVSVPNPPDGQRTGHLVADVANEDDRLRSAANVLLRHRDPVASEARSAAEAMLDAYPICRVASVRIEGRDGERASALVAVRNGPRLLVEAAPGQLDLLPSRVYDLLAQQSSDPFGVKFTEAIEDLQRDFEPQPTIVAVEETA